MQEGVGAEDGADLALGRRASGGEAASRPSSVGQQSSATSGSRPSTAAWQELRGSRPNSALVATHIEGYDLDFLVSSKHLSSTRHAGTAGDPASSMRGGRRGALARQDGRWQEKAERQGFMCTVAPAPQPKPCWISAGSHPGCATVWPSRV